MVKFNVLKASKYELKSGLKIQDLKAKKILKHRQSNSIRDIKPLFTTVKYENHVNKVAYAGKAKPYKPAKKSG